MTSSGELLFYNEYINGLVQKWESREDKTSWYALQIREKYMSQAKVEINRNLSLIQTCVAVAPLFGLLGTVTGMIEVFQVMAFNGGGDARSMAGGVSKATLPTMAGMVVALSGVFATIYLNSVYDRECNWGNVIFLFWGESLIHRISMYFHGWLVIRLDASLFRTLEQAKNT